MIGIPSRRTRTLLSALLVVWLVSSTSPEIQAPRTTIRSDFYQAIITNNLFRPLGWTKPKPAPAFELIATVIKRNGKNKALIRSVKNRKVYYVSVGELAAEAAVERIERQSVTLNVNGESKVYWLPL